MASQRTQIQGIYQETNGFYIVRITKKDPLTGKIIEKRKKVSSYSIQDAIEAKAEMVKELKEELETGASSFRDITKAKYSAYADWYLKHQLSNGIIRKNVEIGDRGVFNNLINPIIGEVKLSTINKRIVLHFVETLKAKTNADGIPYSEAYYKRAWTLFRASVRFAVKMGFLMEDSTHLVSPRFVNVRKEKEKVALTREQSAILLKAAQNIDEKFYFICLLGIVSGLRWAEITALQYKDINFEDRYIQICKSQHKNILNHKVKNSKSHSVPLIPVLRDSAIRYCNTYGKSKTPNDFLFQTKNKKFVNVAGYNRKLKAICESNNLPQITFHQLRATCNVLYLSAGFSQVVVSKILNHSSPQMSFLYNRMGNEQKQEVMEKVWALAK